MADGNSGRSTSIGRLSWPIRRRGAGPANTVEDIAAQDIAELDAADRNLPPPEPMPMADPPQRFTVAILRLAGLGLALVLALALTMVKLFVAGPPSIAQLRAEAGVDGWTTLAIGVKDDQPGVAFYNPKDKIWSGFDIDIAYLIAEDLGFRRDDVRFYAIESEDRARMQAVDKEGNRVPVQLVIASYSITQDRREKGVAFSNPYLYTEQSVVTRHDHEPVTTMRDLADRKVCSLSTSTSVDLPRNEGAIVIRKNKVSECFDLLRDGQVEAVTTDAAILAGYVWQEPQRLKHWDFGLDDSEKWGINVGENKALQTLVNVSLYKSFKDPHDNRWELAYRENLQKEVAANGTTPIAVAQQPPVERPEVRQLPWEYDLP